MSSSRCLILVAVVLTGCKPEPPKAVEPPPAAPVAVEQPRPPKAPVVPKSEPPKKPEGDRVVLTERAAKQIRLHLAELPEAKYLRVRVADDKFKLDLDTQMDPSEDLLGQSRGVPVVVDRNSAALLPVGIVVDFIDEGGTRGFKFVMPRDDQPPDTTLTLAEARKGFTTTLRPRKSANRTPAPTPPADLFQTVRYPAPPGQMVAYLSPDPKDGKKRPAIVWITGGDCNSIDGGCWRDGGAANDQSASAYRKAGIVMMFPALRGGNDNPGAKEGFFGEVDDVLAAAAFLRKQPHVDPARVYLGGHSTGGTLALLTAECSDSFRAVFSFGPTDDVLGYGIADIPFVLSDPKELRLRAPGRWLHSIRTPTFVIEGEHSENTGALRAMERATTNPKARFFAVKGANHFNVLAPTNRIIAEKIFKDTGPTCDLTFTEEEFNTASQKK